jgi:hypothetical protein
LPEEASCPSHSTEFYGALLLFAALELARHGIKTDRYFITVLIAILVLIMSMTLAFAIGIGTYYAWECLQRHHEQEIR